jgi:hypothetical protein
VFLQAHQWDPADRVDVESTQAHLVQVGHQAELDAIAATVIDDAHDRLV